MKDRKMQFPHRERLADVEKAAVRRNQIIDLAFFCALGVTVGALWIFGESVGRLSLASLMFSTTCFVSACARLALCGWRLNKWDKFGFWDSRPEQGVLVTLRSDLASCVLLSIAGFVSCAIGFTLLA